MTIDSIHIREAQAFDSQMVLVWRNDLQTRLASRNQELISPGTHDTWFQVVLENPDRHIYIGEANGVPIGQVRFDLMKSSESLFEVSISIDPEMRGRGLAVPLLLAAESTFLDSTRAQGLHAYVNVENLASQILFSRAGYSIESLSESANNWWVKELNV